MTPWRPHSGRFAGRAYVLGRAVGHTLGQYRRRAPAANPGRILIAHHLLLGDTLMLTPLLAKLAERYPTAELVHAMPAAFTSLYASRPYGACAVGWSPRSPRASLLFAKPGFDLAIVPGDNRHAWLARAAGSHWVVAFAGDRPVHKNWAVDELIDYPDTPAAWGDMVAGLIPGPPPAPFRTEQWPAPACPPFDRPGQAYAVLHVGASSPLKSWPAEYWRQLAQTLGQRGLEVVWSGGPGEEALVTGCDPGRAFRSYAGALSLPQLWHLLAHATLLVCPDTGIAHLGRIVGVPTVALFGPGSQVLCGAGMFWRGAPYRAVTVDPFPCRDQHVLFRRQIDWVRRCGRGPDRCATPACMQAIGVDDVLSAADAMLRGGWTAA